MAANAINVCKTRNLLVYNLLQHQTQHTRNTFMLKRRVAVPLSKKGAKPANLKSRHFLYDLVEDTSIKRLPDMQVVLTKFVEGFGNEGDVLSLRPTQAYRDFLMPGVAVYATPENIDKYKKNESEVEKLPEHSSPYAQQTADKLSKLVLQITMNKTVPWILGKWHIRASFRKAGYIVPEKTIEMPEKKIYGPDLSLQDKEFYVTITVNNKEQAHVRCRIHHWAVGIDRLPWVENHWKELKEPLFPEQANVLASLPLPP